MNISDYPGLYQAADRLSARAQRGFFAALFLNMLFLVLAAVMSLVNYEHWATAVGQAFLLACALASSAYLALVRPERLWYLGRAVAESIKTLVWRYVTRAEPFFEPDEVATPRFLHNLGEVVHQNQSISNRLISHIPHRQLTPVMTQLRAQNFEERRDTYVQFRIDDQLDWYSRKAIHNDTLSRRFFWALILINLAAFVLSLIKISHFSFQYFPIDVLIAIAGGVLAWMQAKRYSELSESYALAAHEINIIRHQAASLVGDDSLSAFVGDAENAFSREHTQWVARKDK